MNLICPKCLDAAVISLDLDDGDQLTCRNCEESYTVADVVCIVESWSKMLPWLLKCPAREPVCEAV